MRHERETTKESAPQYSISQNEVREYFGDARNIL
jgi:hypothetical protein